MKFINKTLLFSLFSAAILSGCGGAPIISTPTENIDTTPMKEADLTEVEAQNWGHLDLKRDTIPGMSVDKAYAEIVRGKLGQKVIVAVIDSGIDITHEELDGVLWTNRREIPGNGRDDDNNGYVDDIHGWNFLGDAYDMRLEFTRLVASGNTSDPRYAEAKAKLDADYQKALASKQQYEQINAGVADAHKTLTAYFKKDNYTAKEVAKIPQQNPESQLGKALATANGMYQRGAPSLKEVLEQLKGGIEHYTDQVNFNLNKNFDGRKTGDNPNDFNDKPGYGNPNPMPIKDSEIHGTHVAAIIAAERNNGRGAKGVANNVEIMSIRAVPNGDEFDKDIAKAIRYAVDNGAKIINGSFGKAFSPQSQWVRDAIKYASDKNVVFVHATGNSSKNVDTEPNFPDDNVNYVEISNTYIRVGALTSKYGTNMVANFSNYGKKNVDVFAPGAQIYSAVPKNKYKTLGGTSMAAPAVAGVAALVWSQYPNLTAAQVKQIILDSGIALKTKVTVGGNGSNIQPFTNLCKTGKIVNAYNALVMAGQLSK